MGSSASSLPTCLSEEEVKNLSGEKFESILYDGLKDSEGKVYSTDFLRVAASPEEREVLRLFRTYFPNGVMTDSGFVVLCRDTKLLNKGLFPVKEAQKLYVKVKRENEEPTARGISYKTWRFNALPEIAAQKGMLIETIISKLSRCDGLIVQMNVTRNSQKIVDVPVEEETNILENVSTNHGIQKLFSEIQKNAVVKIQNKQRVKQARTQMRRMSEIRDAASNGQVMERIAIPEGEPCERKIQELFVRYCPQREISMDVFIKLLKDARLLDSSLSKFDAGFIFDKSKARAGSSQSPYKDGVIVGKRLTYQPFRACTIPATAEFKGVSVDKFMQLLATADPYPS